MIDDLDRYDKDLMTALLNDELIHKNFTTKIADIEIFEVNKFIDILRYKEYWANSFTKFNNKIGLAVGDKYIDDSSDVVLNFPYKDCVLKAGMTKEDVEDSDDANELFLNETIAKSEIDELLEPKILINANKYDEDGVRPIENISEKDNLIIKGNNLIALYSLKQRFTKKVKLIYLDVPYNTGNDSFNYNDNFNQSSWLTFIFNRLKIAKQFLEDGGFIFVHIDDHEVKYLGPVMDEIFGQDNFIELVTVVNNPRGRDYGGIANMHEFIYVYKKTSEASLNLIEDPDKKFHYEDEKGGFDIRELRNRNTAFNIDNRPNLCYPVYVDPNSADEDGFFKVSLNPTEKYCEKVMPKKSRGIQTVWRWGKEKFLNNQNINVCGKKMRDGGYSIQEKYRKKQKMARSVWWDKEVNSERGTVHLQELFGKKVFNYPKPEGTLKRIIELATERGDIVLDFFMGSATTQAVAMKMHRQFIGIEQMDYINTVSVPRLQKVIAGEQGGVSKELNWQGGGSFIYAELMEKSQGYLKDIKEASDVDELLTVYNRMKANSDINFRVDLDKFEKEYQSGELSNLDNLKKELILIIDKNQLYYNYSNIDDDEVRRLISDSDYKFNKSFYSSRGK